VEYARRYEHSAALMVLDLDNFKEINDSLGHHAGDQLVKGVAARLRRRLRATDLLARIGGDEFAVFLPQAAPGEAERVAGEIVDLIAAEPIVVGPNALSTRASVGVALHDPEHPLDPESLLIQADLAMYEAKNAGGDRHAVAAPSEPTAS
jgi:diguanylate cyclase (GGDEF)-like protein